MVNDLAIIERREEEMEIKLMDVLQWDRKHSRKVESHRKGQSRI